MSILLISIIKLRELLEVLIFIRMIMSFIPFRRHNILISIIYELTEPIIGPARELIAKLKINTGMFDFSPLLALLFIRVLFDIIIRLIMVWK